MISNLLAQSDSITQVGVGSIIAILVVKEAFAFASRYKNNNNNNDDENKLSVGEQVVHLQRTVQFKDTCTETVKRFDSTLNLLEKKVDAGFASVKELIVNKRPKG